MLSHTIRLERSARRVAASASGIRRRILPPFKNGMATKKRANSQIQALRTRNLVLIFAHVTNSLHPTKRQPMRATVTRP